MNTERVAFPKRGDKQNGRQKLAESDPRKRDRIVEVAGIMRAAVPVKASRFAVAMGHSETHESRIRSGERQSPTSRAAIAVYEAAFKEGRAIEHAGFSAAYIEVTLRSIAMWPSLEKLTSAELRAELEREIAQRETRANGEANDLDADALAGKPDIHALIDAHTKQATASTRIVAICQILAQRE